MYASCLANSDSWLFCVCVCCCTSYASHNPSVTIFVGFVSISSISVLVSGWYKPTYRFSCHDQSSHLFNSPWYSGGGNSLISPPIPLAPKSILSHSFPGSRAEALQPCKTPLYNPNNPEQPRDQSLTPLTTHSSILCASSSRPVLSQCHSALLHSQMHREH